MSRFIDNFEDLDHLDDWLRTVYLPSLPADILIVFSSRNPLADAWHCDLGWQSLIHEIPLQHFSDNSDNRCELR